METLTWIVIGVALLLVAAWYLSYSAARLDRLHAKVEGALSALDAALVRRSEAALELVNSGGLDPASGLLVAGAAAESLEQTNAHTFAHDPLEGQHFAGRERVESELTEALTAALSASALERLGDDPGAADALARLDAAGRRVELARRFHNDAVKEVQRVRGKAVVRLFRLAGHADLPHTVEFADVVPTTPRVGRTGRDLD
ncbi:MULTISPECIES: hypothetical protein [unclassified Janibacter]|uniref:hypothetical protein n=1 Tax=unclassified Janibacter TaxID=2649294 RepID=UPI003CFD2395